MKIQERLQIDIPELNSDLGEQDEFRCQKLREGIVMFIRRVIADHCVSTAEATVMEFDVTSLLLSGLQSDATHALVKERFQRRSRLPPIPSDDEMKAGLRTVICEECRTEAVFVLDGGDQTCFIDGNLYMGSWRHKSESSKQDCSRYGYPLNSVTTRRTNEK